MPNRFPLTLEPARFANRDGYGIISPPLEFAMNRLPHITVFFAAVFLVAVVKKLEKGKEPDAILE